MVFQVETGTRFDDVIHRRRGRMYSRFNSLRKSGQKVVLTPGTNSMFMV